MRAALTAGLLLIFFSCDDSAVAQLSVRTLSTVRRGELPRTVDGVIPSYYTDLIAEYQYRWLQAGVRSEAFTSPAREEKYWQLRQRYAEATWAWGSARLGNVYGAFGKSMILRGFELPGFIYESQAAREQQRVIRDFDGYKLSLAPGPLAIQILGGTPIDPLRSPRDENRRTGRMGGAEARLSLPGGVVVGAAYLEHRTTFKTILATRFLAWSADELLVKLGLPATTADFYAEYATPQGVNAFGKFDARTPRALYLSGNFTWRDLGGSWEYKDYRRFDFGLNDPPSLVRENPEYLLNRATHVLHHYSAEEGYQLEFFYSPLLFTRLIGNYSLARFEDFSGSPFLFQERYLGIESTQRTWSARLFVDSSQDDELAEIERFTGGVTVERRLKAGPTLGADWQWQRLRRAAPPFFDYQFRNAYFALRLQDWHKLSLAVRSERSKDPDYTSSVKYFTSATVGWQPVPQIDLQLFAGNRRDGLACDHGYCVPVLGFQGVELRLETRW